MASISASPLHGNRREVTSSPKRRKTVKLTVLSLSDIQVRVPPPEPLEQIIVGEGGAYYACKEKEEKSSSEEDTITNDAQCTDRIIAPTLPQHLQPLFDKVGLGLDASSPRNRQKQQHHYKGNLSLSASVSFSGSCPPEHMHVLSPSLCSRTGRMVVESDPILRHGEDVADQSVHSMKHNPDGTISHFLVAKWDGADALVDDGDTERIDKGVDGVSADSSKSENWRRRRAASFRRMGTSSSISSQPHMTASLQHRPDDGATRLYSPPPTPLSPSDQPTPARVPSDVDGKVLSSLDEEGQMQFSHSGLKVPHVSSDKFDTKQSARQLPGLDETDESSSPKSSKSSADIHPFPRILRGVSPPPPARRVVTSPPIPPAPPVAADLPDIIELNVDLLVGRDVASRIDRDSGGMLQPRIPDSHGVCHPIGGVAHLVLKADDLAIDGIHTLDLPVRRRPPGLGTAQCVSSKNILETENTLPLVELGDDSLLRVKIEVVSPIEVESTQDESVIQWTLSGASAAVAAGKEEAYGEDVSVAKTFDDDDQVNTASDILATDVAKADERIPRTGMFCAALPGVLDMWGNLTKKCIVNCVDHCDDDALVYVNDNDGDESVGSTIDTVYSKIMF